MTLALAIGASVAIFSVVTPRIPRLRTGANSTTDEIVAEGEGTVVSYDYDSGRKAPIPEAVRAAIDGLAADA